MARYSDTISIHVTSALLLLGIGPKKRGTLSP